MSIPSPKSFELNVRRGVATVTLNRPDRLNSLTFEIYQELADTIAALADVPEARAVVITGRGRGFCSGGDQDDIIAELFHRDMQGLLAFTRATGRLVQEIATLRKPVVAGVNGVAVGAGAVVACACDLRVAARNARFGFVFSKVGLSGADMGAAYLLPQIVGRGRAAELLYFGDLIGAEEAHRIGLVNQLAEGGEAAQELAAEWAGKLARGPAFAHAMTKQMLQSEAGMSLPEAIEAEAQAQAICMQHPDFRAAHEAFKQKPRQEPRFEGAEICEEEK